MRNASEIFLVSASPCCIAEYTTVLVLGFEPMKCALGIKYAITSPSALDHCLK